MGKSRTTGKSERRDESMRGAEAVHGERRTARCSRRIEWYAEETLRWDMTATSGVVEYGEGRCGRTPSNGSFLSTKKHMPWPECVMYS